MRTVAFKVLKPFHPRDSEKVEIHVQDADHPYNEIRVPNVLTDRRGNSSQGHREPASTSSLEPTGNQSSERKEPVARARLTRPHHHHRLRRRAVI